ncbi:hypothetical protein niasHS_017838 [Heterodera schachtii]|uniref:Myosin motor domain-containing protein n=1 Tax=Heterodera schachtii TaxID=97005 RepID=A0ABD2HYM3_HETSC
MRRRLTVFTVLVVLLASYGVCAEGNATANEPTTVSSFDTTPTEQNLAEETKSSESTTPKGEEAEMTTEAAPKNETEIGGDNKSAQSEHENGQEKKPNNEMSRINGGDETNESETNKTESEEKTERTTEQPQPSRGEEGAGGGAANGPADTEMDILAPRGPPATDETDKEKTEKTEVPLLPAEEKPPTTAPTEQTQTTPKTMEAEEEQTTPTPTITTISAGHGVETVAEETSENAQKETEEEQTQRGDLPIDETTTTKAAEEEETTPIPTAAEEGEKGGNEVTEKSIEQTTGQKEDETAEKHELELARLANCCRRKMDALVGRLGRNAAADAYFVRCIRPNESPAEENHFDRSAVLRQIRQMGLLAVVEQCRAGFAASFLFPSH